MARKIDKARRIGFRLNPERFALLLEYSMEHKINITETMYRGLDMLFEAHDREKSNLKLILEAVEELNTNVNDFLAKVSNEYKGGNA